MRGRIKRPSVLRWWVHVVRSCLEIPRIELCLELRQSPGSDEKPGMCGERYDRSRARNLLRHLYPPHSPILVAFEQSHVIDPQLDPNRASKTGRYLWLLNWRSEVRISTARVVILDNPWSMQRGTACDSDTHVKWSLCGGEPGISIKQPIYKREKLTAIIIAQFVHDTGMLA